MDALSRQIVKSGFFALVYPEGLPDIDSCRIRIEKDQQGHYWLSVMQDGGVRREMIFDPTGVKSLTPSQVKGVEYFAAERIEEKQQRTKALLAVGLGRFFPNLTIDWKTGYLDVYRKKDGTYQLFAGTSDRPGPRIELGTRSQPCFALNEVQWRLVEELSKIN